MRNLTMEQGYIDTVVSQQEDLQYLGVVFCILAAGAFDKPAGALVTNSHERVFNVLENAWQTCLLMERPGRAANVRILWEMYCQKRVASRTSPNRAINELRDAYVHSTTMEDFKERVGFKELTDA